MNRLLCGFVAVLCAALLAAMSWPVGPVEMGVAGTVYYVSSSGNDSTAVPNDATKPFRSPRGAYAAIPTDVTRGDGDHLILLTDDAVYGQLDMTARLTDAAHRIILKAAEGMTPTIDAHSTADGSVGRAVFNHGLRIRTNHVVVQGLRFINTNRDTTLGRSVGGGLEVMVRLEGSNVVLADNYFDGNGRTPTIADNFLLVCLTATENIVSGNRFDYSGGKAHIYVGGGCPAGVPGTLTIRNNVLSRFGNRPPAVCGAVNFGGLTASAVKHAVVENNTFYDNGGGCYGLLNTNGSALTVRNNIFAKITGHRFAIGCSGVGGSSAGIAYNSVVYGNTNNVESTCGSGGWTLSDVYTGDPYFANPEASPPDLHLQSTTGSRRNGTATWHLDAHCSAAIDRAAVADAFDREPSPNGGRRNLGAYGNTAEASKSCRR